MLVNDIELGKKVEGTDLTLSFCKLSVEDVVCIAEYLNKNAHIKTLGLLGCGVNDLGAKVLAKNTTLNMLMLVHNQIGDEGAEALAKNTTWKTLGLCGNFIGDKGIEFLAQNSTLSLLFASRNKITDVGAVSFTKNSTLSAVNLLNNDITDELMKKIDVQMDYNRNKFYLETTKKLSTMFFNQGKPNNNQGETDRSSLKLS